MALTSLDGKTIQPTYANGRSWLPSAKSSLLLTAPMTRCVTGHAPIGDYYEHFNIPAEGGTRCGCGALRQTRTQILSYCPQYAPGGRVPTWLAALLDFLDECPLAFALRPSPEGIG